MKTLAALLTAMLFGAASVRAHEEHEHPSGPGLFGHPPEHVHVLLNPMPVYGMMIGMVALAGALIARSLGARTVGLSILIVAGASAWPTHHFGENAYKHIRQISDDQGQRWLDEHMGRAEKFLFIFYGTAFLGIAALATQRKFPKVATVLTVATLITSTASAGLGGWISRAGGHIRHSEFRHGAASPAGGEHGMHESSHESNQHDTTQHMNVDSGHKHGATPGQPKQKTPLPDSIEGAWQAIHAHHAELEAAIKAKKFSEVQSHTQELSDLLKRLVELSHPDHKPAVENGVKTINQVLTEIKQSAETGSELVLKNNFDVFVKSLGEIEQQMKNP